MVAWEDLAPSNLPEAIFRLSGKVASPYHLTLNSLTVKLEFLPLNNGLIFHTVMGLRLANCPYETSRKKRGMPQSIRNVR